MTNKILLFFISLIYFSSSVLGADFVLKAAHNGSAGHPFDDGYKMFKQVIETETNGGTPPYSYLWSNTGTTTPTSANLSSGQHIVTIMDNNGCNIFPYYQKFNVKIAKQIVGRSAPCRIVWNEQHSNR